MDISSYFKSLDENEASLNGILKQCSEKELCFKEENKWCVLEIAEHILVTERIVCGILLSPPETMNDREEIYGAEKLNRIIVGLRARKIKAPENLQPKGEIKNAAEFGSKLSKLRTIIKQAINTGRITIDNRVYKHPLLGEMTIRDWLHFIPAHATRHMEQMKEVIGKAGK